MPRPDYIGDVSWTKQPGAVSGIEGAKVFYDIPYRGRMEEAAAFRARWVRGASCPITGFEHLYLHKGPTITEEGGGAGNSVLRFEGPDLNAEFGEDNDETTWFAERRSIELPIPDYVGAGVGTTYVFNAQIAVVTYTRDSKPSRAGKSPAISDPEWVGVEKGPVFPIPIEDLEEDTHYKISESRSLLEIKKDSENSYHCREWHEKIFTALENGEVE